MVRGRYRGYRGKDSNKKGAHVALIALIVALVLAVAGLLSAQRYIVYTDAGVRLELPFFHRDAKTQADLSVIPDIVHRPAPPNGQ